MDLRDPKRLDEWTIPQWFLHRCKTDPESTAYRYKDLGLYHDVTWAKYRTTVAEFLAGMQALGLKRGQSIATMSDPCNEFLVTDMAGLFAGAVCYGIYTTCSVPEVAYQIQNGEAEFFLAENQEFVDKVLNAPDKLPQVRHIVVFDPRALFNYTDDRIISYHEVVALGRARLQESGDPVAFLERNAAACKVDDTAVLVYTSGTTGPPKGAMHDHASLMWGFANAYLEAFPELREGRHRAISHLPMAHLIERSMSICLPLVANVIPHIGEEVEDLPGTLYEVQPTFLNVVPRILEKISSQILIGIERSSWLKRASYRLAMRVGQHYRAAEWEGRRSGAVTRAAYGLARLCVFDPMLRKVGLSKVQAVLCAGAPLPLRVQANWLIWGVNVRNLYGITEGGFVLCQGGRFPHPEKGGLRIPPRELELAGDGELKVRGRGLFRGYWKNPEGTAKTMEGDWLLTGDIAAVNERGEYRIVDRKKDIMITAGGKNVAPSEIENMLKGSPYISEVILIGDTRKYITALIEIDFATVSDWAARKRVLFSGYTSLCKAKETISLIEAEVAAVNADLARVEQVKKFRIIPKELDPEEGDTTPTRKVKRAYLHELFRELIDDMYADGDGGVGRERPKETTATQA